MHDTYRIPEGGVCGAYIQEEQRDRTKQLEKRAAKVIETERIDWSQVPEDAEIKIAEVVQDVSDTQYVPTQVLKDTLEKIRRKHHGDEETTEEASAAELIEEELKGRGEDAGYATGD